jgi:hypothetical protein
MSAFQDDFGWATGVPAPDFNALAGAGAGAGAGATFIDQSFMPGFSGYYPASGQMQQPFVPGLSDFYSTPGHDHLPFTPDLNNFSQASSGEYEQNQDQQLEAGIAAFMNGSADYFGESSALVQSIEQQDMSSDLVDSAQHQQVSDPAEHEMSEEDSSDAEEQEQQSSDPTEYEELDEDCELSCAPEDEDEDGDEDEDEDDEPDNDEVDANDAPDNIVASSSKAPKRKGKAKALINTPASIAATKLQVQQQSQQDTVDVCHRLAALMNTPGLTEEQKRTILCSFPPHIIDTSHRLYSMPRVAHVPLPSIDGLTEENYVPQIENEMPEPKAQAPLSAHPPFQGLFRTKEQAMRHRKRVRVLPKNKATDVDRVKRFGRKSPHPHLNLPPPAHLRTDKKKSPGAYWTRRIYSAIINIDGISDGEHSIHRIRIVHGEDHEPADLEASAHHVFDSAIAVHERGWRRPTLYHKDVKRGKLYDTCKDSLEQRLERICWHLSTCKAMVDDVVRGGIPMALLCDNPEARLATKLSNNTGNDKRSGRLALARAVSARAKAKGMPEPKAPKETKAKKTKGAAKAKGAARAKGVAKAKGARKQTGRKGKEKAVEVDGE